MLTEKEKDFLVYWEANREVQKKSFKQYIKGLSSGLGISAAILILVISGWYKRADMEVNSKLSSVVFAIALLGIAVFMAWLHKNYQWEMMEQKYLELLYKQKKESRNEGVLKVPE